jgi:rhodanese-related sulfurtransferase
MTTAALTVSRRITPVELAAELRAHRVRVIDVREPVEYASGHIGGSLNVPLRHLAEAELPHGPLVLVCHSGNRSLKGVEILQKLGHPEVLADLEGGVPAWEQQGFPVERLQGASIPLMRQVQIAAGSLVLLGVILSQTVASGWIWLAGFVGAGLVFAGVSGFCGMARLLAAMPWNRVRP